MKKMFGVIIAGLILTMVHVPSANAGLVLYFLDEKGNSLEISDGNSPKDTNGSPDIIDTTPAMKLGTWTLSITASFDQSGNLLHLGGMASTSATSTLTIFAAQTELETSASGFEMDSSGFSMGTVLLNAYYSSGILTPILHGNRNIYLGSFPSSDLAGSAYGSDSIFSGVAIEAIITQSKGKITNFDVQLASVPEPTLLILLGLGLSGLGLTMKKWM
jgi:hypothetical protein